MDFTRILNNFTAVSSTDFEKRFSRLFGFQDEKEVLRFKTSLDELVDIKAALVAKCSKNPMIGYQVEQGLGAICITCVEEHVTRILVKNGFSTQIYAREFPGSLWDDGQKKPSIHTYNVVRVCGSDFIVDIDVDPFLGRNSGIVIAPLQTNIPIYSDGFLYHCRSINNMGKITYYKFSYKENSGRIQNFLEGNIANYLTIAPYHGLSDESLCPLCFSGGATLYFGFEKCYFSHSEVEYRIPLVLVCPVLPGDKERTYQLSFVNVCHIKVQKQEVPIKEQTGCERVAITILLTNGRKIELLLAGNGTLVANDFVSFVRKERPSAASLKVSVSAANSLDSKIILPVESYP